MASPSGLALDGFHESCDSPAVSWRTLATMFVWLSMTPDRSKSVNLRFVESSIGLHTFGQSRCATAIDEEREILIWIDLRSSESLRPRDVPHRSEMLVPALRMPRVADQSNPVFRYPNLLASFQSDIDKRQLREQCSRSAILQLVRKLFLCVSRICWRHNASSPMRSPYDRRRIDAIWCVESQDIALLPIPETFQSLAEVDGCRFYLCEGVGAIRIGVDV